ncbi:hypothetical protein MPNT_400006 [Candidatus Methylacidithermus pantelleriae]|uniref:Uncharacterized protein n=2 Tax=Candidatus Methylacidithermus pantelleriae TaxID=2744239 RepID=A0A8J2BRF5_9BACT|nr:hypothetical protein MPNT_400006 [Candidatus Methylacidithermus pantelleriae]
MGCGMGWIVERVTHRNGVDPTVYHLVWSPKDRCHVLTGGWLGKTGAILDAIYAEAG